LLKPFLIRDTVFLEIGPGDCALAREVARMVQKVYAVDVSRELLHVEEAPPNFSFILSDGLDIPVPPESISVAYSNQMMEHLHPEDAYDQLRNIHAALKPGGIYICITPSPLSGPWDISRHFDRVATGLHMKEYSLADLQEIFYRAGFSGVDALITFHGYRLSPGLAVAPWIWIERIIGKLPGYLRRKTALLLTAVKIVAVK
jgi:SAM-dependent methyltransferase